MPISSILSRNNPNAISGQFASEPYIGDSTPLLHQSLDVGSIKHFRQPNQGFRRNKDTLIKHLHKQSSKIHLKRQIWRGRETQDSFTGAWSRNEMSPGEAYAKPIDMEGDSAMMTMITRSVREEPLFELMKSESATSLLS